MARVKPHKGPQLTRNQPSSLEKTLSSIGKIRIMSLLTQVGELHISEIAKRTEQSYSATERHLRTLEKTGIVEERDYGRVRIFKLLDTPRVKMLKELILQWDPAPELLEAQA